MSVVRSKDGTEIAYDHLGSGPPVILVGGLFSYRAWPQIGELAERLSECFTVINYDRRGRGESGDTKQYTVEREFEDLAALLDAVGGSACVWGWSSGGILAARAAAAGVAFERIAVYEPPCAIDEEKALPPEGFVGELERLVAEGRRAAAVRYFFVKVMGMPVPLAYGMWLMRGPWRRLMAAANTAPYEAALIADNMRGQPLRREPWDRITAPTLVLGGEKSEPLLQKATRAFADVLPNAELRVLEGQGHNPSMKLMAAVLTDFFGEPRHSPAPARSG